MTRDIKKMAIMISIKPKYCELIIASKKTIELRKSRPKVPPPVKVYIYCTLPKERFSIGQGNYACSDNLYLCDNKVKCGDGFEDIGKETISLNGKVIGEFVCDKINVKTLSSLIVKEDAEETLRGSFLSREDIYKYLNVETGKNIYEQKHSLFYLWHISDLKIYDKPKELREFGLSRPPQSWCYVQPL